ncbi:hypothetical protein OGAPHI_003250 [Ogataea philodendri]|uniref:Cation efflux protein transmembrane domain-containing protein n=1 Tax=Ogataea philodendri TaxID=1378263 RepID=A0A9P8T6B5_9ASCO|nr:uncharacterized protein OGAPHI_003250 [Ogataea philodendri]KAH3666801.1 hypothetical protein OGAPHI_003250 [Ogataea philodendri]
MYGRMITPVRFRTAGTRLHFSTGRLVLNAGHQHQHSHTTPPPAAPVSKTPWSKVKDFFNPHLPISHLGAHSHSHSGGHSHSHDPDSAKLYDTKDWANEGVKITWIGLGVNVTMAVSKFAGGLYFHSQALVADSVHAVGDLVSDVLTLSTVKYSTRKPSELYPFGFGKVETLGSFFVSAILLYAGFQIGWGSLIDIMTPVLPHGVMDMIQSLPIHGHSHTHTHVHDHHDAHEAVQGADINAAWLALASIGAKEWLFRATSRVGERLNSKVLIANAWHHRVDSLTSVVALVTISSGYFLNIYWLDSVGGLLVSVLVMKVGLSGLFQSFKELTDKALPTNDPRYISLRTLTEQQLAREDSVLKVDKMSVLPSGTNMNVIVDLSAKEKHYTNHLTLEQMSEIGEGLKRQLKHNYTNLKTVSVQFVPETEPHQHD